MASASNAPASARVTFSSQETYHFLAIISEMDLGALLDSRRQRNQKYFLQIKDKMQELGYGWSWKQLRTHWKNLKTKYNKELYEVSKSGAEPSTWVYFGEMNAILAHRPRAQAARTGVDSDAVAADGNASDVDEDQSDRTEPEDDTLCATPSASETSSPSSRPRKRRRQGNEELHELLAAQHKSNAQLLEQHANKLFEQQKALLDQEAAHMQQMVTTITGSFLQGTQMMMSALMNTHQAGLMGFAMPQGSFPTPQGAFPTPQGAFPTPHSTFVGSAPVQQHNSL
ncbi:uncharacterized protein LOC144169411 [Haemaphysalis longicornis]